MIKEYLFRKQEQKGRYLMVPMMLNGEVRWIVVAIVIVIIIITTIYRHRHRHHMS